MSWDCSRHHIVLVGMMGAGKSSVGRVLAQRLGEELGEELARCLGTKGDTT